MFISFRINNVNFPVTGPSGAFQGSRYLYVEASGQGSGQTARYCTKRTP